MERSQHTSDNPLKNAPDDNPAFAELGRLFDVNPVDAGVAAFETVMDHQEGGPVDATAPGLFEILAVSVLEAAVEQFLDYRAMLDELLPSLYRPRDSWAKFTKVSLFLRATRDYVVQQQNAARGVTDGYYHDLAVALAARRFELVRVGSSNYTDLCHSAIRELHQEPVLALNGSLDLSLDPYKNEIVPASRSAQVARFLVPFLFTQSGVKPLTSVDVSRKYVAYYDAVKDSDAAVVAGFGFHGDDGLATGPGLSWLIPLNEHSITKSEERTDDYCKKRCMASKPLKDEHRQALSPELVKPLGALHLVTTTSSALRGRLRRLMK